MSHFSVLVITPNKPTKDELTKVMQPWHEYESTGIDDEYVIDVDITNEIEATFNKPVNVVKVGDHCFDRYDDTFYVDDENEKDFLGKPKRVFKLPEGSEELELLADEARKHGLGRLTMKDAAEWDYGKSAFERDGRWFRKTNQNRKWDWWQVGGRWTGLLVPNYDPNKDPDNIETCPICNGRGVRTDLIAIRGQQDEVKALNEEIHSGSLSVERLLEINTRLREMVKCNGCNGEGKRAKWPTERKRIVGDQMRVGDIPLITLRDEAESQALKLYDKAQEIIAGRKVPNWNELREKYSPDTEKARNEYWNDPVIKNLKEHEEFKWADNLERYNKSRNEIAIEARNNAICTFAVVKGGQWYERGSMGWWACVSDEKDDWPTEFAKLVDDLPPDYWVSVIDCHI